jgi:hypothetical protein
LNVRSKLRAREYTQERRERERGGERKGKRGMERKENDESLPHTA